MFGVLLLQAFRDLDALIEKAKDMVGLVNKFAAKIEDKKGALTEDEVSCLVTSNWLTTN